MKQLFTFLAKRKYKTEFNSKLSLAQGLKKNIDASTKPKSNHFVDANGNTIRGWHKAPTKFSSFSKFHPLELYYASKTCNH